MAVSNKSFKSIKVNMFFFFLLLAIVFWALTKFSKENTAQIETAFTYQNIPEEYLLAEENPNSVNFYITTNGIDFLIYKIKKPTVVVDVSKYFDTDTKVAKLSDEELKDELTKQIGYTGTIRNLSEKGITIQLQGVQAKKIPVVVRAKISYRNGFRALDSVYADPDSILVSGPSRYLDSITRIATKEVIIENVGANLSEEIALLPLPYKDLVTRTTSVTLKQEVMEFAQKKITLPISVENIPANTSIKLIPQRITVTCVMPIEKFNTISEQDFQVVCDYNDRNTEENFLSPTLVKVPSYAKSVELSPKKIDFLIFKK
ncbi:hypothetical protein G5B37_14495 [Rasiella rasia]|uniref:YbbR-like domain-containing protein n=1 Tax=Rasiella rasia TaxID=2744027 RepID=A0A6G6GQL5_9FLAO|nr:CdaR family protein [Rasiella rasia]QIE60723.1 hypothetical protein G5B37_14495 [Rasiella rasia]